MPIVALLIRGFLAAVLVVSGAAKLADIQSFTTTLVGLGFPAEQKYLVRKLSLLIPLIEVCIGIMLVSGFLQTIINGILLLVMCCFSVTVIIALQKRLHVECKCFGSLSDSQFNSKGLVRSLLLTVCAGIVFWQGNLHPLYAENSPGPLLLLLAGYVILGVVAMQATQTVALLKDRGIS